MAERAQSLTNIIDGLAIEAAAASDLAFDELRGLDDRVALTQLAVGYAALNGKVLADLEQQRNEARQEFNKLVGIAAGLMGHEDSSFYVPGIETLPLATPEADNKIVELPEILLTSPEYQNLSPEYRDAAETSYKLWEQLVNHAIEGKQLPENYALPPYLKHLKQIVALASTYETMGREKWQPEVIFVPEGLDIQQWNALYTVGAPADDLKGGSVRAFRRWDLYGEGSGKANESSADLWEVAIIDSAPTPAIRKLKVGGLVVPDGKQILEKLSVLPNVPSNSSVTQLPDIIRLTSPSESCYLALQRTLLMRRKEPIDENTRVIAKGYVMFEQKPKLRPAYFAYDSRQKLVFSDQLMRHSLIGLRPCVRAGDL